MSVDLMRLSRGSFENWPAQIVVHTDGASRGNPGPASVGVAVYDSEENLIYEYGEALGDQTNNFAEYTAVKKALELAKERGVSEVTLKSDSQLLIRQLTGEYKVKSESLRPIFRECRELVAQFNRVRFEHVRREFNKTADSLANEALDLF